MINWTERHRQELRRLYDRGFSALRIAEEMFLSDHHKDAVLGQIRRMGLVRTTPVDRLPRPLRVMRVHQVSRSDWMHRLAEVPADTRSLTQRTFGDPLAGRSALDKERRV